MAITIRDVAKAANVSITAASFALNGTGESKVSPQTRQRILEAAQRLNYRKNTFGRALRKNRSNLIGVVFPSVSHALAPVYLQGMEDELTLHDYGMLLYSYNSVADLQQKFNYILDKRVDGIVIFPESPHKTEYYALYQKVSEQIPIVAFSGAYQTMLPKVLVDPFAIGKLATSYLLTNGHKQIAIVCEPDDLLLQGYREAHQEQQLPINLEYNFHDFSEGFNSKRIFDYLTGFSASRRPTAVIAGGDLQACEVIRLALEAGWKIPQQLSVMGLDGLAICKMFLPELTAVYQPHYEQGRSSIQLLLELVDGKDKHDIILQPSLSIGQSVGKMN